MTDKQIIIDGVDVSGCKHYKNRNCIVDYCLTDMPFSEAKCELNTNCNYKQLKRKEQECEKLKTQILSLQTMEIEELKNYKQSLTEIKKIAETENNDIKVLYNRRTHQRMNQILQKISEAEDDRN